MKEIYKNISNFISHLLTAACLALSIFNVYPYKVILKNSQPNNDRGIKQNRNCYDSYKIISILHTSWYKHQNVLLFQNGNIEGKIITLWLMFTIFMLY